MTDRIVALMRRCTAAKHITPAEFKDRLIVLGVSQVQFSRIVGVDPRTVRRWVSGQTPVPYYAKYILLQDVPRWLRKNDER